MPDQTALTLTDAHSNRIWQAINAIPDEVLTDYLTDNVIDDQEIEDITLRLEKRMTGLTINDDDHALIRRMVRNAVEHIRQNQKVRGSIEGKICPTTLGDIRLAMGQLLQSGQIALEVADASRAATPSPGSAIPEERPEDYDEDAPNIIE